MRLIGKKQIQDLICTDSDISSWISAWVAELRSANWKQPADVTEQFPNVHQPSAEYFIFPVGNSDKRIHLKIAFQQGIAMITDIQ